MSEVTIQKTRKRIKVQQPFVLATLALGVTLIIMANQSGSTGPNQAMLANGILTTFGGAVWAIGLRIARWWFHD